MSVIITFPSGRDWFKANWVFRQLCESVARHFPDAEIATTLDMAQAFNALDFKTMQGVLAVKVMSAIREVAQGEVGGPIQGWLADDSNSQRMYREAMAELVAIIDSEVSSRSRDSDIKDTPLFSALHSRHSRGGLLHSVAARLGVTVWAAAILKM